MELAGLPAPTMDWNSVNLNDAWDKFERHATLMFEGPLKGKTGKEQVAYILLWIGDKGRDVFASWTDVTDDHRKSPKEICKKFKAFVQPKQNPIFARYKFYHEVQNEESIDVFVSRLSLSARECDFAEKTDEMIRDRIVFGCKSHKVREKLIDIGKDLTLEKAIQVTQSYEYSQKQLKTMAASHQSEEVHYVRAKSNRTRSRKYVDNRQERPEPHERCVNCGKNKHSKKTECPARGERCNKCQKFNHFAKVCRSKSVYHVHKEVSQSGNSSSDTDDSEQFFVYTVNCLSSPDQAFVNLSLGPNNTKINVKVDTGSMSNILPLRNINTLGINFPLNKTNTKLTSYTGNTLPVTGKADLKCTYKNRSITAEFYIVDTDAPALLSLQSSIDLGLIKLTYALETHTPFDTEKVLSEYKDLFHGIGLLPGESTLHLKENALPVVCPVRKIPFALHDKLRDELDSMVQQEIITKVSEPTEWVNALVCVEKPSTGKLRVCLDPKSLNDNLRRPHYPMRTLDDITSKLKGAKFFSVLDATKGYWSIRLDEKSSFLTTFGTPFGRFRYLRMAMGLKVSQDIFQRKLDEALEGLQGIASIVDDILVYGRTREEHDQNLKNVLMRARENGLKFNPDKCTIGLDKVKYFGHVLSSDGLKPDQNKISAILDMKVPENRSQLESLLGMITYLSKFAPNLAEVTSPMRALLKKDTEFIWNHAQTESLNKVKSIITQTPVLSYYDPSKPVKLQVDASSKGLGVACLQEGKPVAYASKTLTTTEQGYAQIEKEMLAILFGCSRFKHLIYGRHTVVESDHKPLESIMKKPLANAPARLQRMLLQLQHYDIEVIHVPGSDIPLGDALSRNFVSDTYPALTDGLDAHVHAVTKYLPVSDQKIAQIQCSTDKDEQMQILTQTIISGWPDKRSDCPTEILDYWNHRDELTCFNHIIFKGQKIIIPEALRAEMKQSVHIGHQGVDKTTRRARDIMFWPGMTKELTDYVLSCSICIKHRDSNTKEPLQPHEVPQRPWQNLACDLFTFDNKEFMVLVDAFSRHFEIDLLPTTKSVTVVQKLKVHFSRFGIPEKLKTDNGPQFSSDIFKSFAQDWNFKHETSSPTHSSSNGLSEVFVKIAKRILQKAKDENRDPYLPLLEYRNTPLKCGWSPAQLLMSRRMRSILPCTDEQLIPKTINLKKARKQMYEMQSKSKGYYDKAAHSLPKLKKEIQYIYKWGKSGNQQSSAHNTQIGLIT